MTSITDPLFTATRDLLVYDDLNRLIQASGKFGGTNQSQTTCNYSYSAIGDVLNKCGVTYTYGDAMQAKVSGFGYLFMWPFHARDGTWRESPAFIFPAHCST